MKSTALFSLALVAAASSVGCASRVAPFDKLDKAQVNVLRLQGVAPPPPVAPAAAAMGALPGLNMLPPETQQAVQGAAAALLPLGQALAASIPGVSLGLPVMPGAPGAAPAAPPAPRFHDFVMLAQMPVPDEAAKGEILDILGDAKSFQATLPACFTPGLGLQLVPADGQPPIDVLVSLNCHAVQEFGLAWPHQGRSLSPEGSQRLHTLYAKLWGAPVPPSGN